MNEPATPFSLQYSPNFPELLAGLDCTIGLSTYQAGKVIFISAKNENELIQLPRTFNKAMGLTTSGNKMAIATKNEIIVLADSKGLGVSYPNKPNTYDHFYVPRATYYTGQVDIHDLEWGSDGLYGVNTSFSCLCKIDENFSFTPVWKPNFISALASEDRCHLNGMVMKDGRPKYVTALGKGDSIQSWRENITKGGVLIDVESNEIIFDELPMPHSPTYYNGKLYMLCSASGEVTCVDPDNKTFEVIKKINGFVRGMSIYKDHMFIGLSKLRQNSSTFRQLPIAELSSEAGIIVMHLPTKSIVAELKYRSSVDEIYDVILLPEVRRPGILNTIQDTHRMALSIPDATFWAKQQDK